MPATRNFRRALRIVAGVLVICGLVALVIVPAALSAIAFGQISDPARHAHLSHLAHVGLGLTGLGALGVGAVLTLLLTRDRIEESDDRASRRR